MVKLPDKKIFPVGIVPTLSCGNHSITICGAIQPEDNVIGNHSTYKEIHFDARANNQIQTLCALPSDQKSDGMAQDMQDILEAFLCI